MTDIEAEDQAGEGTDGAAGTGGTNGGGDAGAAGDDRAGTLDAEPGGDAAGGAGDRPGDESAPRDDESGPAEGTDPEEGGEQATVSPKERLEALQEDIDAVRRRVAEDTLDQGDEAFIQEGEASEDEPVDDTIAPPG